MRVYYDKQGQKRIPFCEVGWTKEPFQRERVCQGKGWMNQAGFSGALWPECGALCGLGGMGRP